MKDIRTIQINSNLYINKEYHNWHKTKQHELKRQGIIQKSRTDQGQRDHIADNGSGGKESRKKV